MRFAFQILIVLSLLWLHAQPVSTRLFLRTSVHDGISPVTNEPLPLTADDIARGLKFNPNLKVSSEQLKRAHLLRSEYSKIREQRSELIQTMGTQGLELLATLEER